MRLHLKIVNDELAKRGHKAELVKGEGHFYFDGPEARDWLERTVKARTINTLTLKQWIDEFRRLKDINMQIIKTAKGGKPSGPVTKTP